MRPLSRYASIGLLIILCAACAEPPAAIDAPPPAAPASMEVSAADPFGDYWYQGEAELTSYDLEQVRYGDVHQGEAVLIFVTEDFSKKKHVKLDYPSRAGDDKVGILKLNMTRNFNTGIYPYSMMTSVFTPIHRQSYPNTLKVTTSSQEWCGHTFTQFNLNRGKFVIQTNSYFESEGDERVELDDVFLEDEVWTLIRLQPDQLPVGSFKIIAGSIHQRFSHRDFAVETVNARLEPVEDDDTLMEYTLEYKDQNRKLVVRFSQAFPHEIEGWEEHYGSGQGITRATRKKRIMLDYWNRNNPADEALRGELGLD